MRKISRREFAQLGTAAALGALVAGQQSCIKASMKGPNVIFFMTDDQRWDSMSCAGNPYLKTPNMDRLAAEGAAAGVADRQREPLAAGVVADSLLES